MTVNKLPFRIMLTVLAGAAAGGSMATLGWLLAGQLSLPVLILAPACALMATLAGVGLICHRHLCAIRGMTRQVDKLDRDRQFGMIMIDENEELVRLTASLNRYLTRLRFQARQEESRLRELTIQADVAEAEKRQSEAVFYSISEAVIVVDPHNELLLANPAAETIFNFSQELHYRAPVEQAIADGDLLNLIGRVQRERARNLAATLQRLHPITGRDLTLKVLASCVLDDEAQPVGVVVIIHDITAELEISRMKDEIISSVSHELKTPLASIRAYAEMLADNEAHSPQAAGKFCEIIQEQSIRLNRMIDDILNISKIEAGRCRAIKQWLNIAGLFDDVIAMMEPQLQEKQIDIAATLEQDGLALFADRDMMDQVMANLVGNAIKYSPPGSTIALHARTGDGQIVIEVEDQGYGIPPEDQDKIFEKFYRVSSHAPLAGGTGLGLNLVRQVVETVHQGTIRVTSTPGQGSCFTIALPVNADAGPAPTPPHQWAASHA